MKNKGLSRANTLEPKGTSNAMKTSLTLCICSIFLAACGEASKNQAGDGRLPADATFVDGRPVADCTPVSGTSVTTEVVTGGLIDPVFVTSTGLDLRLFILEKPGRIRIVKGGTLVGTPFLDIAELVLSTESEQGLLGLAFHPSYPQNGRFFVNYTAKDPRQATVIAEYQVSSDGDVANPVEERLLVIPQPAANHNGGMIAFGPDGYLYIGMGDGGGSGDPGEHGQDNTTLLGDMLRIDVDSGNPYGIPAANPYANSPNGVDDPRPEIWAMGLRNPWRFSFDRKTGDLYIADVGQGSWEEVNVQPAGSTGGENYGWDEMEGAHCFEPATNCDMSGKVLPVAEYDHGGDRCSITGGYVYRGTCMPDLQGRYFYADYCSGQAWTLKYTAGQPADVQEIPGLGTRISSFGEDATGELYLTNLSDGNVYRIVPAN